MSPRRPPVWDNLKELARVLDEFVERHGANIRIISAYRAPDYNRAIAGTARNSLHQQGMAADFVSEKGTPAEWATILREMRKDGVFRGGIGINSSFVHVDVRGYNADWGDTLSKAEDSPARLMETDPP